MIFTPLVLCDIVLYVQREEQRVASLESKLSELSTTVGNYDRQRELDAIAIQ